MTTSKADGSSAARSTCASDCTDANTWRHSSGRWTTIVPEQKDAIENAAVIGGRIVVQYLVDVQSRLTLFDLKGAPQGDIALPGVGTVDEISGLEDAPDVWYAFASPLAP